MTVKKYLRRVCYYMNTETGELLTIEEAMDQFENEYDGFDPTNILTFEDIYVPWSRPCTYTVVDRQRV